MLYTTPPKMSNDKMKKFEMVIKNPSSTLQILNVKAQFSEFNVSERLKDSVKLRRKKVSACLKKK